MTTENPTEAAAKKDTQRLQRAIVDGLEDVKGQDIQVFNTEHLSPLFERVIIASGTSNRQTKALAASVRDAVRDAGFPKPRTEGEENGEWIIVDCGAAVAHIMQPAIRQYYHLEEIWGDKPVRLKFGAPKPAEPVAAKPPAKAGKPGAKTTGKPAAGKSAGARSGAKTMPAKSAARPARGGSSASGTPAKNTSKPTTKIVGKSMAKAAHRSAVKTAAKRPARPAGAKKTGSRKA